MLQPVNMSLKGKYLIVLKPAVHVSTAEAYQEVIPKIPTVSVKSIIENRSLSEWRSILKNDFEESVFKQYPIIQQYKTKLYEAGAVYASMSGSGSSVFGIFEEPVKTNQSFSEDIIWSGVLIN